MKIDQNFGRRRFLRGVGALGTTSMALPLLPSLGHAAAHPPKRLVVLCSGNGTIPANWRPSSKAGALTSLGTILAPLERHKAELMVIEGLDLSVARRTWQPRGFHAHERGLGGILTGRPLLLGDWVNGSGYASGISVDQFIANKLAGQTSIHSLQVGLICKPITSLNRVALSYAGSADPRFAENDGSKLFQRIFADSSPDTTAAKRIRDRRRSVLDYLSGDLTRLHSRLSAADRLRLSQHTQEFRDLEKQLSEIDPGATCASPAKPTVASWVNEQKMTAISDVQIKQTVMALACDRTRVATIQFGRGLGGLSLRCIGKTDNWHSLSHESYTNLDANSKLTELNTYIAGRFAALLDEMKAVREGDGTLLDNSVVLWVNELGRGNSHSHDDLPVVIAGNLQGFLNSTGRHIQLGDRSTNDLLITLCHGFGYTDVVRFGQPELCTGTIDELLA